MEIIINGAAASSIYAMMAVGVTLIFGVSRVVNFAHGAFYALGAYYFYWFTVTLGFSIWIGMVASIVAIVATSVIVNKFFIAPTRNNIILVWMMTFALAFVIREIVILVAGVQPLALKSIWPGTANIFGTIIERQRIGIICVAIVCLISLWIFLKHSRYGRALRAVAQNEKSAALMGISVEHAYTIVLALSVTLAALAAILIAPISIIEPDMGLNVLLMAFTVVILGGIGSVGGTFVASLIIGFGDTLISYFISPRFVTVFALGIVFLVLLIRPVGLAGLPIEERA